MKEKLGTRPASQTSITNTECDHRKKEKMVSDSRQKKNETDLEKIAY